MEEEATWSLARLLSGGKEVLAEGTEEAKALRQEHVGGMFQEASVWGWSRGRGCRE